MNEIKMDQRVSSEYFSKRNEKDRRKLIIMILFAGRYQFVKQTLSNIEINIRIYLDYVFRIQIIFTEHLPS